MPYFANGKFTLWFDEHVGFIWLVAAEWIWKWMF